MVKSRIFDNTQLLKEHPELPHYKEEVVCFRSEYKDRSYGALAKTCVYPNIFESLNKKNFTSITPCSCARNCLIFELRDSADALVDRLMK